MPERQSLFESRRRRQRFTLIRIMIEDARPFNPGRLVVVLAIKIYEEPLWIPAQRGIIYESQGAEPATNVTVSDTLQSLQKSMRKPSLIDIILLLPEH